jgi:hypothetical protein
MAPTEKNDYNSIEAMDNLLTMLNNLREALFSVHTAIDNKKNLYTEMQQSERKMYIEEKIESTQNDYSRILSNKYNLRRQIRYYYRLFQEKLRLEVRLTKIWELKKKMKKIKNSLLQKNVVGLVKWEKMHSVYKKEQYFYESLKDTLEKENTEKKLKLIKNAMIEFDEILSMHEKKTNYDMPSARKITYQNNLNKNFFNQDDSIEKKPSPTFVDIHRGSLGFRTFIRKIRAKSKRPLSFQTHLGNLSDLKIFDRASKGFQKKEVGQENIKHENDDHIKIFIPGNEKTLRFNTKLKFAYNLSRKFFFHVNLNENQYPKMSYEGQLESIFIIALVEKIKKNGNYQKNLEKLMKIIIMVHDHDFENYLSKNDDNIGNTIKDIKNNIKNRILFLWDKARNFLEIKEKNNNILETLKFSKNFELSVTFYEKDINEQSHQSPAPETLISRRAENLFNLFYQEEMVYERQGEILLIPNLSDSDTDLGNKIKKINFITQVSEEKVDKKIQDAWVRAQTIDFIPIRKINNFPDFVDKKYCSRYLIGNFFDRIVLNELTCVLKKWYSMTEKGIYITNMNETLSKMSFGIKKKEIELAKKIRGYDEGINQTQASLGSYIGKNEILTINRFSKKAWSFFIRHLKKIWLFQIRMRQYRCSEIFKEKILHLFLSEPLKWEDGYTKSLKECEDLFVESAKGYQIPLINKTLFSAKNELIMVLKDYYADLKASPARELNSLDHIEKDINKAGPRSSQMVVGFALTSAIRLRGYGNFQFVSSYAYGPHIFNFSCINDRSTLENETKGYVKPLRIQPSLNFDIRL